MSISGVSISGETISGGAAAFTFAPYNVRVTGYKGLRQAVQRDPQRQFSWQHEEFLEEPYEWTQTVSVGNVATSSAPVFPDGANIIAIEIPDNQQIRFEYNSLGRPGGSQVAALQSPRLAGVVLFDWRPGTTLSMIDISGVNENVIVLTDDPGSHRLTSDDGRVLTPP